MPKGKYLRTQAHKDRMRKVSIKNLGRFAVKGVISPMKGKKHDKKTLLKISGKNHWNWKGGITPTNKALRNSPEYKLWRLAVLSRDRFKCVFCGISNVKLHADHIKPFAFYPELRFAIDNGRTLCIPCHELTDTYKKHKI